MNIRIYTKIGQKQYINTFYHDLDFRILKIGLKKIALSIQIMSIQ